MFVSILGDLKELIQSLLIRSQGPPPEWSQLHKIAVLVEDKKDNTDILGSDSSTSHILFDIVVDQVVESCELLLSMRQFVLGKELQYKSRLSGECSVLSSVGPLCWGDVDGFEGDPGRFVVEIAVFMVV